MTKTQHQQRTRADDDRRLYRGPCGGWHYRGTGRRSHKAAACKACQRLGGTS